MKKMKQIIVKGKKKKKKYKIGDGGGASLEEVVLEKIEPMENGKGKKKKKAEEESGADSVENEYLYSLSNADDIVTTRHKRKKDKSVSSTTGGISFCAHEINEETVIDHTGFDENEIEGTITEKVKPLKDKKRKKKKKNGLGGGSFDKELANDPNVLLTSNGESSRDRCSKRKQGKFMGSHIQEDTSTVALKVNKRNNSVEPSQRITPSKKVRFCDRVEFLSLADNSRGVEKLKDHSNGKKKVGGLRQHKQISNAEDQTVSNALLNGEENHHAKKLGDGLIRGKRFSKEEDEIVQTSVLNYIQKHQLGEKGLEMVLKCGSYPEVRDCWREIGEALPSRPHKSVYHRAHVLFERSESRCWTPEEIELVMNFHKHGPDWETLADALGKHRVHVKDTWRRIQYPNMRKGRWLQDELEALYDLVNIELRMKAFEEKKLKHGMQRDSISWEAVSERLSTRSNALCCQKWYDQLNSPLAAEGKWADADDFRLIIALDELDAACQEDVDWDKLLEHRSGDVCRKRWNEMVRNIGEHGTKSFAEQVDIY